MLIVETRQVPNDRRDRSRIIRTSAVLITTNKAGRSNEHDPDHFCDAVPSSARSSLTGSKRRLGDGKQKGRGQHAFGNVCLTFLVVMVAVVLVMPATAQAKTRTYSNAHFTCTFEYDRMTNVGKFTVVTTDSNGFSGAASQWVTGDILDNVTFDNLTVNAQRDTLKFDFKKKDTSAGATLYITVRDAAGNWIKCDPVFTTLTISSTSGRSTQILSSVDQSDSAVTIQNAALGLEKVEILANGNRITVEKLKSNEERTLNIGSMHHPGHNVITVNSFAQFGRSAFLTIARPEPGNSGRIRPPVVFGIGTFLVLLFVARVRKSRIAHTERLEAPRPRPRPATLRH